MCPCVPVLTLACVKLENNLGCTQESGLSLLRQDVSMAWSSPGRLDCWPVSLQGLILSDYTWSLQLVVGIALRSLFANEGLPQLSHLPSTISEDF